MPTTDMLPPEKGSCAGKFTGSVLALHLLQKAGSKAVHNFGPNISGSKEAKGWYFARKLCSSYCFVCTIKFSLWLCHNAVWCYQKGAAAVSCCFSCTQNRSQGPLKEFAGILQRTKGISYLKCRCKEVFPCWEPHTFQTTLAKYMATCSFVLLSRTAHEIISWQWVKVPYFPVFDIVDKMGEK